MGIGLFDTAAQLREARAEIDRAVERVLESGRFIGGPEVEAFEREFAEYLGVAHVVGVANGTDALTIALLSLGIGPGDEVVVPSFTFYASAEAIPHTGGRPVFCDIDPDTFCVTADTIRPALTDATRAIVVVDLFGRVPPMAPIRALAAEHGLALLEDAAQAAGASLDGRRAGALADAATFSFFPSKNLFCLGDGGAIATSDDEVAERARLLRSHGSKDKSTYDLVGFNSRLDALQAAVLRSILPRLDGWNEGRRALAAAYAAAGLAEFVALPPPAPGLEPVHHLFVGRAADPEALAARLARAGIEARGYYRTPIHRQPAMARYAGALDLPGTDAAARSNLALPMSPSYGAEVVGAVRSALASS